MTKYIFKNIFVAFTIIFGVVSLIFTLFNVVPNDPARMMLGQRTDSASIAAIHTDLGLDKPIILQYTKYINDLMPISLHSTNKQSFFYLNPKVYPSYFRLFKLKTAIVVIKQPYLRRSYQHQKNVSEIISEAFPNTFFLALASIIFASIIGIGVGIVCALNKNSWFDKLMLVVTSIGMSLPSFFAAILIAWLFSYVLGQYTGLHLTGNLWEVHSLGNGYVFAPKNIILPLITLGIRPLSVVTQLTRNSMLDVLNNDFIRTARAKGLSEGAVVWKHALKNSLNPVITSISGWFASLMAGVVFVEYIFGWKGLGYTMVNALNNYDMPLVMGAVITVSLIFVTVNILVDIVYSWLDPRIKAK